MKLLRLLWATLIEIRSYIKFKKSQVVQLEYKSFTEKLFLKHFGEHPSFRVCLNIDSIYEKSFEILSDYDLSLIYKERHVTATGYWTETSYYEAYNFDCSCIIAVSSKQSYPYEFMGVRLPSNDELKYMNIANQDHRSSQIVAKKFDLKHVSLIELVTDSEFSDDVEDITNRIKRQELIPATLKEIEALKAQLQEASNVEE
jgi:hypothetical protein